MNKIILIVMLAVITKPAIAQTEQEKRKEQALKELTKQSYQPIKKWTLSAKLFAQSKDYESKNIGVNEIHGFNSMKDCLQAGFKISKQLNEALAKTEQEWKEESPTEWSCNEQLEFSAE
uniref:hypothetical protein n=1 Tax=Pseudomonas sp. RW407 TaxID=2202894 RepID=UPI0011B37875|nr:hypothetical protein [Pseudomonas sp. RW407]